MNGVLILQPPKCDILRFTYHRDLKLLPIDAEYTILYTNLRGNKALTAVEKKLLAKQKM